MGRVRTHANRRVSLLLTSLLFYVCHRQEWRAVVAEFPKSRVSAGHSWRVWHRGHAVLLLCADTHDHF